MKREKSLDIELMRIFAVFFVIFNHTQKYGYQLFSGYRPFDIRFIVYGFLSVFCKFSVPLFYMIFGALMLDREPESYPRLLRRVGKMAGLVLGWSAIYFAVDVMRGEESFSITTFFLRLYESNWNFSFWYLYTYIALLMTLPLLQKFAQGLNDRDFLYLFGLFFLFSCFLPTVEFFLSRGGGGHTLNRDWKPGWLSAGIVVYPLLGYFLRHRLRNFWNGKRLGLLWLCNVGLILCSVVMTGIRIRQTGETPVETFHNTFVCVNAAAVFVSCQYLCDKIVFPAGAGNIILSLGSATLGIYLLHVLFMFKIGMLENCFLLSRLFHLNGMLSTLIYCLAVLLMGYGATQILRKIPGLKFLVRG